MALVAAQRGSARPISSSISRKKSPKRRMWGGVHEGVGDVPGRVFDQNFLVSLKEHVSTVEKPTEADSHFSLVNARKCQ